MYKSFAVRNFKCFGNITVPDLSRINLIAGMNNSGKTALLEALFIHSGISPDLVIRINVFRGINPITFEMRPHAEPLWVSIFRMLDTTKAIEFVGEYAEHPKRSIKIRSIDNISDSEKMSSVFASSVSSDASMLKTSLVSETLQGLRLDFSEGGKTSHHDLTIDRIQSSEGTKIRIRVVPLVSPSFYQAVFNPSRLITIEEDMDRFGRLEAAKKTSGLQKALRIIEPRLKDLAIITEKGTTLIGGDIGFSKLVALPYMGEGVARLMSLLLSIGFAEGGVVFIDEIENGFHYSVLEKIWRSIGDAANAFNVQVFATTHSFECIRAANKAFANQDDGFRFYRLERIENETSIVPYDKQALSAAIKAGYEVR